MKQLRRIFLIGLIAFGPFFTDNIFAQPGGGGGPGGGSDPGCWPPPCIPIDGGIGWLIAAGALYGGKKAYSSTRKRSEEKA